MSRPHKRLLDARRERRIRGGFSWIDRRFMRDSWIERLDRDEILVYLFLVLVADKQGLSYYSDARVCGTLKIPQADFERARNRLQDLELIAYERPLYQVLALDVPPQRAGNTLSVADLFRDLAERHRRQ